MKRCIALVFIISAVLINGCYYDVEEELYPQQGLACDTAAITYTQTIQPIIAEKCLTCHSQALQLGNIVLEGHMALADVAATGALLGAIKHESGFSAMPQGEAKLDDCTILKIEKWVNDGTPNN